MLTSLILGICFKDRLEGLSLSRLRSPFSRVALRTAFLALGGFAYLGLLFAPVIQAGLPS